MNPVSLCVCVCDGGFCVQVTDQVRSAVEERMKEAGEQRHLLETRLLEAEKETQARQEEGRRALAAVEQEVRREGSKGGEGRRGS